MPSVGDTKIRGRRPHRQRAMAILALCIGVSATFLLTSGLLARNRASGAGGCGNFADAVALAEIGDTVTPMITPPRTSGGAIIGTDIVVEGGWNPPPEGCTELNEAFEDREAMLAAGFTFDAPTLRSGLIFDNGPVLGIGTQVMSLTIKHVALKNDGPQVQTGGGINGVIDNSATVLLQNVAISDSEAISGGGLYLEVRGGSTLTIEDSEFFDNAAQTGSGFEIRVYDGSKVYIRNSRFYSNTAQEGNGGGGRILIANGMVDIRDSSFYSNRALGKGGGLAVERVTDDGDPYGSVAQAILRSFGNDFTGNQADSNADLFIGEGISVEDEAAISIAKTVGTAQMGCADASDITVSSGTTVYYCYTASNTGNTVLSFHDLVDSELGTLLEGFPFDLQPGASISSAAAGLTISDVISVSTTSSVTWTAYIDDELQALAVASATVQVGSTSVPAVYVPAVRNASYFAHIDAINVERDRYAVSFTTIGFTPAMPGRHVHFFFNTVPPSEAGIPGSGPWQVYSESSPFLDYGPEDRPIGATALCILVANADHSVIQGSGNCYPLPL